jgi:hypothetical protein
VNNTIGITPIDFYTGSPHRDPMFTTQSHEIHHKQPRELNLLVVETMKIITRETYTWTYKNVVHRPWFLARWLGKGDWVTKELDECIEGTGQYGYIKLPNEGICVRIETYDALLEAFREVGTHVININDVQGDITIC